MDNKDQELLGLLGGGLATAAVHYGRTQDNLDRRLDRVDDRIRDAADGINRWLSSGTVTRLLVSTVQDVLGGIAMSAPVQQAPTAVPTATNVTRPDISGQQRATGTNWPPVAGQYDAQQRITQVGELTAFGLALTYQEVRAAILGLVQPTAPNLGAKDQIFNVFNSLISSVAGRNLSWEQYKAAWDALFNQTVSLVDPHRDPARTPAIGGLGAGVASAILLPFATDTCARVRVTATGAGIVASANPMFTIGYGTEYRHQGTPVTPAIVVEPVNGYTFNPVNATSAGYGVAMMAGGIAANTSMDFRVLSESGLEPA